MKHLLTMVLLLVAVGCASSPQLYPNQKLKEVGKSGSEKDIEECEKLSEEYMTSGKGKQIASEAGKGAAVGGAAGGVIGLLGGGFLKSAVVGAAVGGAAGATAGAVSPDQVKRNYIDHCLEERGYKVMGWK